MGYEREGQDEPQSLVYYLDTLGAIRVWGGPNK